MTGEELYRYGEESAVARACIPRELMPCLPRLERMNGRIVVEFWYYFYNVSYPWCPDTPLYYAAFDLEQEKPVAVKALSGSSSFTQSWADMVMVHPEMREIRYLDHCARLLDRGNITDEEIIESQAMWLDAQASDIFGWLYCASGVRPEAVAMLLSPEWAEKSRYLLRIWDMETMKYTMKEKKGSPLMQQGLAEDAFRREVTIYAELRDRGPRKGSRWKEDY